MLRDLAAAVFCHQLLSTCIKIIAFVKCSANKAFLNSVKALYEFNLIHTMFDLYKPSDTVESKDGFIIELN